MSRHPSYANPIIKEALCEIHFTLPEGVSWEPANFGKFYKHIQSDFPEMEPVSDSAVRLHLQPDRVELLPGQSRMRYRHASRNILLQLAADMMTVNVLPKYEGWEKMKQDIYQSWKWIEEVLHPQGITRVGLRYINHVPKSAPSEKPNEWFSPNDYIAPAALNSLPGVFTRTEIRTDTNHRAILTLGELPRENPAYFILDIDCIAEDKIPSLNLENIIDPLHDNVWAVFESFMTPRLESYLKGGEA